jgi:histidinol-phosphate phosphatase family protein
MWQDHPNNHMDLFFSRPRTARLQPGLFLDRDGVINRRIVGGYVTAWSQFTFVRGIKRVLATLTKLDIPLIVVSNQACVGKGMLSPPDLLKITHRFVAALAKSGARIDAVYYCPHTDADNCSCRKPRPGLLERAARDWRLDLTRSVMIGDSQSDLEAARAVSCRAVLFNSTPDLLSLTDRKILCGALVAKRPSEIPGLVNRLLEK